MKSEVAVFSEVAIIQYSGIATNAKPSNSAA